MPFELIALFLFDLENFRKIRMKLLESVQRLQILVKRISQIKLKKCFAESCTEKQNLFFLWSFNMKI
jgi:hypothetical protein